MSFQLTTTHYLAIGILLLLILAYFYYGKKSEKPEKKEEKKTETTPPASTNSTASTTTPTTIIPPQQATAVVAKNTNTVYPLVTSVLFGFSLNKYKDMNLLQKEILDTIEPAFIKDSPDCMAVWERIKNFPALIFRTQQNGTGDVLYVGPSDVPKKFTDLQNSDFFRTVNLTSRKSYDIQYMEIPPGYAVTLYKATGRANVIMNNGVTYMIKTASDKPATLLDNVVAVKLSLLDQEGKFKTVIEQQTENMPKLPETPILNLLSNPALSMKIMSNLTPQNAIAFYLLISYYLALGNPSSFLFIDANKNNRIFYKEKTKDTWNLATSDDFVDHLLSLNLYNKADESTKIPNSGVCQDLLKIVTSTDVSELERPSQKTEEKQQTSIAPVVVNEPEFICESMISTESGSPMPRQNLCCYGVDDYLSTCTSSPFTKDQLNTFCQTADVKSYMSQQCPSRTS